MKKRICMALAAMLVAGSVPAYAAETVTHTYTAEVGTTNFRKNGEAQPLDVPVYIKNDYVMLPLRTFLTAVGDGRLEWDGNTQTATFWRDDRILTFDAKQNQIHINGTRVPVSGKLDVKDGRLFVPLRNWETILFACGYSVEDDAIRWDSKTKTATVAVKEKVHEITEEALAPVYTMELTNTYDKIENYGGGWFLATKYNDGGEYGLGQGVGSKTNSYYFLDRYGTVQGEIASGVTSYVQYLGEGLYYVRGNETVVDVFGDFAFSMPKGYEIDRIQTRYVEGLIPVYRDEAVSFMDTKGKLVISQGFLAAEPFSDGLAAVKTDDGWGYIDKKGSWVIEPRYSKAASFSEGMARVSQDRNYFYIDKQGNPVTEEKYRWGSPFYNGTAFAVEGDDLDNCKTWLIDKAGKEVRLITEGKYTIGADVAGVVYQESIEDLPDGDHAHVFTYYDANGKISPEEYARREKFAEGIAPMWDAKSEKCGYVNENGKQVIAPVFGKAEKFRDGFAVVANEIRNDDGTLDVEWGIIKKP